MKLPSNLKNIKEIGCGDHYTAIVSGITDSLSTNYNNQDDGELYICGKLPKSSIIQKQFTYMFKIERMSCGMRKFIFQG